jgi:hypothetical protein
MFKTSRGKHRHESTVMQQTNEHDRMKHQITRHNWMYSETKAMKVWKDTDA